MVVVSETKESQLLDSWSNASIWTLMCGPVQKKAFSR